MKKPLVSVIMPVYNGEKTIQLALNSLLCQTYSNWKCIIINDGSTDNTPNILDALTDKRFNVIHLAKNRGRGYARQIALNHAEGEYLAYLDADDFFHQNKLLHQVEYLEKNKDVALVGTKTMTFDSGYKATSVRGIMLERPTIYRLGNKLFLSMPTAMIRLPEATSFKYNAKLNASEDRDYFSRYLDGKKYFNLSEILLYYLVNESTSYRKVLQYTAYEIVRGCTLAGRNNGAFLRTVSLSSLKFLIYAFTIPFLGTEFYIKRRGKKPDTAECETFQKQKQLIKQQHYEAMGL